LLFLLQLDVQFGGQPYANQLAAPRPAPLA
jgi:hypothetical protein